MYLNIKFKAYKGVNISGRISDLLKVIKADGYINCNEAFQNTKYKGKILEEMKIVRSDSITSVAIIFVFDTSSLATKNIGLNPCIVNNTSIIKAKYNNSRTFTLYIEVDDTELDLILYACKSIIQNSHLLEYCEIVPDNTDLETMKLIGGLAITIKTVEEA